MNNDKFRVGEKVCSRVMGKYEGIPGRIVRKSYFHYGRENAQRWNVELENGIIISLLEYQIKKLET